MGGGFYARDVSSTPVRRAEVFAKNVALKSCGARTTHQLVNIFKKKRECVDSEEHPKSEPIVIAMDVTKSRGDDAVALYNKVPLLIGTVRSTDIMNDPVICWMAVGDAKAGDAAPLQVSQFESDERVDEALEAIWLEEGGGGTGEESYELAAYYGARNMVLDANNRGEKGLFFFLGDEGYYPEVNKDEVKKLIGDDIPENISTIEIFQELQDKFDVFFIFPEKSLEDKMAGIDAEIKKRLDQKGGRYQDVSVRETLVWEGYHDLDLHVVEPSGFEISYERGKEPDKSPTGGQLDVDCNVGGRGDGKPVENIRWPKGEAPEGEYTVFVRNFSYHGGPAVAVPFKVESFIDGEIKTFEGETPAGKTGPESDVEAFKFTYKRPDKLEEDRYAGYANDVILSKWKAVLPEERVLKIEDPNGCVDIMLGVISLMKGGMTLDEYIEEMEDRGQTDERCADVRTALASLADIGTASEINSGAFQGLED